MLLTAHTTTFLPTWSFWMLFKDSPLYGVLQYPEWRSWRAFVTFSRTPESWNGCNSKASDRRHKSRKTPQLQMGVSGPEPKMEDSLTLDLKLVAPIQPLLHIASRKWNRTSIFSLRLTEEEILSWVLPAKWWYLTQNHWYDLTHWLHVHIKQEKALHMKKDIIFHSKKVQERKGTEKY